MLFFLLLGYFSSEIQLITTEGLESQGLFVSLLTSLMNWSRERMFNWSMMERQWIVFLVSLAKTSSNMLWFCVCVELRLQMLKMKLNFDWRRVGSVGRFSWPFMDFWTTSHGLFFWTHYCVCNQSKMCAKSLAVTHFVGLLCFFLMLTIFVVLGT